MIRSTLILMLAIIVTVWLPPQTGAETIPRPELAQFVSDADVVAYIRITSGVAVPAGGALYTADVVRGFKGVEKGDRIELGFYTSYAIGAEYLAFLAKTDSTYSGKITEADRSQSSARYVGLTSHLVMLAGMGMMEFAYIEELSVYGVNVESGAILPKSLKARRGRVAQDILATYLDDVVRRARIR